MSSRETCAFTGNRASCWLTRSFACGACALSLACSAPESESEAAGSTGTALIGGSLSQPERDAVVFLRGNHADGHFDDCSGTLLSPHVVLTAKHCVTLVQPGQFVCTGAGSLKQDGLGAGVFGAKLEPARIEVYSGTAPVGAPSAHGLAIHTSESGDACHDDVAALVLDTPMALEDFPLLRLARPTAIGESVRLVGYGSGGRTNTLIERRELTDIRVIDVGHDDGVTNPNATTPPRSFAVGGGTACFGDSGGPALAMDTGALVGIYSRITGDCLAVESRNTFMLAASFSVVFQRAFQQAGEQPQLEPAAAVETQPEGSAGAAAGTPELEPEPARHEALHCSFVGEPGGNAPPAGLAWTFAALAAALIRRRFSRGPF